MSISDRSTMSRTKRVARRFWFFSRSRSCPRMCGGCVRAPGSAPRARSRSARSCSSRSVVAAWASAVAVASSCPACRTLSPTPRRFIGSRTTSRRRMRASSSSASRRAMPMWLCAARAAYAAIAGSTPSRRTSSSATASGGGVRSGTCRDRLRKVISTSSTLGAHSSQTVRSVGSSMPFSSALPEDSFNRSESSMITTRHRPTDGRRAARGSSSLVWSTEICSPSVRSAVTSACVPCSTVRQLWQVPQPGSACSHSSAAAKARAATERPEPGGPVNSHACIIPGPWPRAEATAALSTSTAGSWPTTSSHTLTGSVPAQAEDLVVQRDGLRLLDWLGASLAPTRGGIRPDDGQRRRGVDHRGRRGVGIPERVPGTRLLGRLPRPLSRECAGPLPLVDPGLLLRLPAGLGLGLTTRPLLGLASGSRLGLQACALLSLSPGLRLGLATRLLLGLAPRPCLGLQAPPLLLGPADLLGRLLAGQSLSLSALAGQPLLLLAPRLL